MVLTNLSQTNISNSSGPVGKPETASPAAGIIIPVYANWFEFGTIHEIERRSLPEFFTADGAGSPVQSEDKNASVYIEYRDFMVQTYRLRPHDYLTITTCRRHLTGDVGAIVRVHAFLEQWGLVNFQAEIPIAKRERPVHVPPPLTPSLDIPMAINGAIQAAALKSTLINSPSPPSPKKEVKILCVQCGVECPRLYYTHTPNNSNSNGGGGGGGGGGRLQPNINLCGLCYAEGRYPTALFSGDFVKVDVATMEQGMRSPWTDEETLLLLSAVEECPDDWDSVAQKVGRPKDQCIFHFLRLPGVEALSLEPIDTDGLSRLIPPNTSLMPFSASDNPIMATLAFLASAVHPKVAAAAAQAAITEVVRLREVSVDNNNIPQSTLTLPTSSSPPPSKEDLTKVAGAGLACAAARAHVFSEEEARKATKLKETLVDLQLQKLRVKMALFEDLERSLDDDRKELEQQRLQLFFDRFNLRKQMLAIEQKTGLIPESSTDAESRMEIDSPEVASAKVAAPPPPSSQNITKL